MDWFIFALAAAVFVSASDYFSKRGVKNVNEYVMAFCASLFTLPFLLIYLFSQPFPPIGPYFWMAWIISGLLNVAANLLYFKALKSSDISLTIPLLLLTPLFVIFTGPLITGEFPSFFGIVGSLLIVLGSYLLKVSSIREGGFLAPFKSLLHERGTKYMAGAAFLWSISVSFDKVSIVNSSPAFLSAALSAFVTIGLFLLSFNHLQKEASLVKAHVPFFVGIGLMTALANLSHNFAVTQTNVLYVVAIKRLSTLLSTLQGHFLFKEKGILERLVGAFIMFIGLLVIRFLGT